MKVKFIFSMCWRRRGCGKSSRRKNKEAVSTKIIDKKWDIFKGHVAKKRLKSSRQRDRIARMFFGMEGHVNLDELYRHVTRYDSQIGYTTVYRTLKLLAELGLAVERKFADGQTRYENTDQGEHHDHLICSCCGKIIEFRDERIEQMQQEIAAKRHFIIKDHRLEIYGECADCLKNKTHTPHGDTKDDENPPSPPFTKGGNTFSLPLGKDGDPSIPPLEKGDTGGFAGEKTEKDRENEDEGS